MEVWPSIGLVIALYVESNVSFCLPHLARYGEGMDTVIYASVSVLSEFKVFFYVYAMYISNVYIQAFVNICCLYVAVWFAVSVMSSP